MEEYYTVDIFYLMLKLGLFKGGEVENWGNISLCNFDNYYLVRKDLDKYKNQSYPQKQLNIGLYLNDFYLLGKDLNNKFIYIAIISVCKTSFQHKENMYILKIISTEKFERIKETIQNEVLPRKRKSLFRRKSTRSIFDSSPLNAVERKH